MQGFNGAQNAVQKPHAGHSDALSTYKSDPFSSASSLNAPEKTIKLRSTSKNKSQKAAIPIEQEAATANASGEEQKRTGPSGRPPISKAAGTTTNPFGQVPRRFKSGAVLLSDKKSSPLKSDTNLGGTPDKSDSLGSNRISTGVRFSQGLSNRENKKKSVYFADSEEGAADIPKGTGDSFYPLKSSLSDKKRDPSKGISPERRQSVVDTLPKLNLSHIPKI